jgi:hypothetical protein
MARELTADEIEMVVGGDDGDDGGGANICWYSATDINPGKDIKVLGIDPH